MTKKDNTIFISRTDRWSVYIDVQEYGRLIQEYHQYKEKNKTTPIEDHMYFLAVKELGAIPLKYRKRH